MHLYNKIYIGHVETINTSAKIGEVPIKSKVVALKLTKGSKTKYEPIKRYGEYYKLVSVEPVTGIVTDNRINKLLRNTGKEEVKVLKKVA